VNQLDRAHSFIEQSRRGMPASELATVFQRALDEFGFRFFSCCSHVDLLRPPRGAVALHNYPAEWVRAFSELDFYYIDPVFHYANRSLTPFFWDAEEFRAELTAPQLEMMEEARRFGIEHGYTVPIHTPRPTSAFRASCSVVPDSAAVANESYLAVQLMACYMYSALSRDAEAKPGDSVPRGLTRRERQCLELAAQGKSDWVAGRILGSASGPCTITSSMRSGGSAWPRASRPSCTRSSVARSPSAMSSVPLRTTTTTSPVRPSDPSRACPHSLY
jgi:uncharacterized membrane protein